MTAHPSEDALIAYQLGEEAGAAAATIATHLEECGTCARSAEEIEETLRVFSGGPVPVPNLDHAWGRLRANLPAHRPVRRGWSTRHFWDARRWLRWVAVPMFALLLLATAARLRVHTTHHAPLPPGPFTEQPRDPEMAAHLETAERLLTTVSHESGPLDEGTRAEAERLLLRNAVYVREARAAGDPAEASVLEDLGRTLTTLRHEPQAADKGWHLRMELNADGLLLDIRILQQNGAPPASAGAGR